MIDSLTNRVAKTIPIFNVGTAVNPITNRLYVGSASDREIDVLDGSSYEMIGKIKGAGSSMDVNPVTNMIYAADLPHIVSVINGTTNTVVKNININVDTHSGGILAVNPKTNMIYQVSTSVWYHVPPMGFVAVIDGKTNTVVNYIPVGRYAHAIAVNALTNKIYIQTDSDVFQDTSDTWIIDGYTNKVTDHLTHAPAIATGIGVNPLTNTIYAASVTSKFGNVYVIDGATNNVLQTIVVGHWPGDVGVNPTLNRVYVANYYDGSISVIDGNPPQQELQLLLKVVSMELQPNISASEHANLHAAADSLRGGHYYSAQNHLLSFVREAKADMQNNTMAKEQGKSMIAEANRIINAIGKTLAQ